MTRNGTGAEQSAPCVIGYARVSSVEQAEEGVSLDAQAHRLRAYCDAHGLTLLRIETDAGLSGKRLVNRPALARALAACESRECSGLVVCKLDRLSRSIRDTLDLIARAEKRGFHVHSIEERLDTGSAQGRFVVTVLAALAQMEREKTAERTREALAELHRQGRRTSGKAPFGWRFEQRGTRARKRNGKVEIVADWRLVAAPGESAILERAKQMQACGMSVGSIVGRLGENPRTGRPWGRVALWRALRRNAP